MRVARGPPRSLRATAQPLVRGRDAARRRYTHEERTSTKFSERSAASRERGRRLVYVELDLNGEPHGGTPAKDTALGEILADISAHFALEEKVMRDRNHDALAGREADPEELPDDKRFAAQRSPGISRRTMGGFAAT